MKVKMIKMGSADVNNINCRLNGIVVTEDNKHLFIEIGCANSPNIKNTTLSQKEYNLKYPNPQYVSARRCYRIDIPEDFYKNSTKEYVNLTRENFYEIPYTEQGIIELLKKFNKNIDEIELIEDYQYIKKYCEENGFYELYDDRLKHSNEILSVKYLDPYIGNNSIIICKYTCYAKDGTEYSEVVEKEKKIKNIVNEYGKEKVKPLVLEYIDEISRIFANEKVRETFDKVLTQVFEVAKEEKTLDIENEYAGV